MKVILPIFYFVFLFSFTLSANNYVSVSATKYNLNIRNDSPFYLRIELQNEKGNTKKHRYIHRGQSTNIEGNYSKRKLKNYQIVCIYDNQTYRSDKDKIVTQFDKNISNLDRELAITEERIMERLVIKMAAEGASYIGDENDGFWAGLLGLAGKITKTIIGLDEIIQEVESLHFDNWSDFIIYAGSEYGKSKFLDMAADKIERDFGLRASTNKYVMSSIIVALQQSNSVNERYERAIGDAEDWKDKELAKIKEMKGQKDFSEKHTYNVFESARKIDLKTITPSLELSFSPITLGNDLNNYWISDRDAVFTDTNNDDELEWADGLYNSTFGGSVRVALSPEIMLGRKSRRNFFATKLFGGASIYRTSYKLSNEQSIGLTPNFFSQVPLSSPGFSLSAPIAFEHTRLSFDGSLRFFIGSRVFLDFNGGYGKQYGKINLSGSEISEGYEWSFSQLKITDDSLQPFYGGRLGIDFVKKGKLKSFFVCGVQFFEVKNENISDYFIVDSESTIPITFSSEGDLLYRVNLGLSFLF